VWYWMWLLSSDRDLFRQKIICTGDILEAPTLQSIPNISVAYNNLLTLFYQL
jgi:hypothetical protein